MKTQVLATNGKSRKTIRKCTRSPLMNILPRRSKRDNSVLIWWALVGNVWYKWTFWGKEKVNSGFTTEDPGRIQVEAIKALLFICQLFDY
jgi:hypothetical protein